VPLCIAARIIAERRAAAQVLFQVSVSLRQQGTFFFFVARFSLVERKTSNQE